MVCADDRSFSIDQLLKRLLVAAGCLVLSACSAFPMVHSQSDNFNSRVNHLVIHFTSEDFERSLAILTGQTDRRVSAHFLLPDPADKSYLSAKLKVYALVNTSDRAWHAGQSYWAGKTGLNDQSIGIEVVNLSGCNRDIAELGSWSDFPVFARSINPRGPTSAQYGAINAAVTLGGVSVESGDLIIGDRDGLAVLSPKVARRLLADAQAKLTLEAEWIEGLASGQSAAEIFGV